MSLVIAKDRVVCNNFVMLAVLSFLVSESQQTQKRPTKRAPDVWDSAAFSSIFLASSFSCSQA